MRSGLESLLPPLEICQIYSRRVRGWRGLHQRVQGFSLMEVLVAGSILVLAIIPMIEVFIRAGRSLSAAGEHSQALFLSQMVVKDMQARHEKNPLLILETVESLGVENTPIAQSTVAYFSTLEDDAAPFGRLIEGVDAGLGPVHASLTRQIGHYTLEIESSVVDHPQLPEVDPTLAEFKVGFKWSGRDTIQRVTRTDSLIARPSADKSASPHPLERIEKTHEFVSKLFYPDEEGRPLAEIVAESGADLQTVEDLGVLAILEVAAEMEFRRVDQDIQEEIERQESSSDPSPIRQAEDSIYLAKLYEYKSYLALQICLIMVDRLERLDRGEFFSRTGTPPVAPRYYAAYLWRAAYLPRQFVRALAASLSAFARAGSGAAAPGLTPRRRLALQYRMLELSNFLTLFGGDTSAFTSALLDLIEDEQLGRNPYAMEYVQSQRKVLADPQLLFGLFPAWRDRLTRVRNIARLVDPVLSRVLTYSQATGAPLGLPEEWPPPALTDGAAIMAAVGLMEEESK